MNKRNGESPTSFTKLLEEWIEYFKELLNANSTTNSDKTPPAEQNIKINTENFTIKKISTAVKSIKTGKSPGNDYNVTPEVLQHGGDHLLNTFGRYSTLSEIMKKRQHNGKKAIIIPVLKKSSKSMSNFRGIFLMLIAAKVFNFVTHRIYDEISSHLRPFQAAFRRGKSCTE